MTRPPRHDQAPQTSTVAAGAGVRPLRLWPWSAALAAVALAALALGAGGEVVSEALWQHRNLGKAFYENTATSNQAVAELKAALDLAPGSARERLNYGLALLKAGKAAEGIAELEKAQKQDPKVPHTWFNLGIAYKRASRYEEATAQLEQMAKLVPGEAITWYNLGVLYKLQGKADTALAAFERASRLDPDLAGPYFQLATAYRLAGKAEAASQAMATFREIKQRNAGAAVPEDLEWSFYSELYETIEPGQSTPPPTVRPSFAGTTLASGLEAATAGLLAFDADADGRPDLLAWSAAGARLLVAGKPVEPSGLESLASLLAVAVGDLDNDGLADLAIATKAGASLWKNSGGRFERLPVALPAGPFSALLFLDYDHDYDLDLLAFGGTSALLRNNGDGSFSERSADFPFAPGTARAAVRLDLVADTQGFDVAVGHADGKTVLYRDRLQGRFAAEPLAGLIFEAPPLLAADLDRDGWTDLLASGRTGLRFLRNDHRGGFAPTALPVAEPGPVVLADLDNRGVLDVVRPGGVERNDGSGRFQAAGAIAELKGAVALAAADFDADGRVDLAAVDAAGKVQLLRNTTTTDHGFLRVGLEGIKNLKLAPGAEVEIKAGAQYQKQLYAGLPLLFGLGVARQVDAVRITWPNGLIQNETRQDAGGAPVFKEAQRLSGSCPMIYTWNGSGMQFITDVLGVAPLGASAGDGEYFPVDHDEYIQIPAEALVARDGAYEVRIAEELREVAFLDQVQLITVDHPAATTVLTNDKFKGPPFPEFRLFGVRERHHPVRAVDSSGEDVRSRLLALDRTYPDGYRRDWSGVAELHHLDLDFGPVAADNRAILVLSGWVDWADGSTFLAAAQGAGGGLVMPYLQVKDAAGDWQTVLDDMGIPAGKPKTIVVDLSGKFLAASREVRIVTNLCVYWDEIYLADSAGAPTVRLHELAPAHAELHFRGFSRVVIHPERKQPESFVYADVRPFSMWNPTPGLYTRYGDVVPLLTTVDDRMVVMGSGDELKLSFAIDGLPPLSAGWRRDFLLKVDGWAKDADANTAYGQTVGPLPYHGMPQYPYAEPHAFPDDAVHRRYRVEYNTRPALRLLRPLAEGVPAS